jgi:hypothetical protein
MGHCSPPAQAVALVAARVEADERAKRAEKARDLASRIGAGQKVSDISRVMGVSENMVYRARAAINEGRTLGEEEETPSGTTGPYHSVAFRDAAEALGLHLTKHRIAGRGFEIVHESPLASGSVTRYRPEISALGNIIPAPAPSRTTKTNPVYLACSCSPEFNNSVARQIRMANGPGTRSDENEDIWCRICDSPFKLIEGSLLPSGWTGAGPGRGNKTR